MSTEYERDYVTVKRAAEAAGRCAETVRRWIRSGRLPSYRLPSGGRVVRLSDVLRPDPR